MVSFNTTFAYSKIAGIADGLFYYNNLAVQFQQTFIGCLLFTSLPNYLFSTSAIVTELNSTWYNCTGITSIPETLIKNATSLTSVYQCFRGIGITTIPVDLFRYNINISSFEIAFYGCNLLTSVPAGLFKYNIAAQTTISFYGVFNSCVKLQVPANIFYEAADKATVFLNKNVDFYRAFYRTSFTGTQGTAPDLWACSYGTGSVNGSQCYRGAGNSTTSLSNYASIPFTWK